MFGAVVSLDRNLFGGVAIVRLQNQAKSAQPKPHPNHHPSIDRVGPRVGFFVPVGASLSRLIDLQMTPWPFAREIVVKKCRHCSHATEALLQQQQEQQAAAPHRTTCFFGGGACGGDRSNTSGNGSHKVSTVERSTARVADWMKRLDKMQQRFRKAKMDGNLSVWRHSFREDVDGDADIMTSGKLRAAKENTANEEARCKASVSEARQRKKQRRRTRRRTDGGCQDGNSCGSGGTRWAPLRGETAIRWRTAAYSGHVGLARAGGGNNATDFHRRHGAHDFGMSQAKRWLTASLWS